MWAGLRVGHLGSIPAYKPLWAVWADEIYKFYMPGAWGLIVLLKSLGYI